MHPTRRRALRRVHTIANRTVTPTAVVAVVSVVVSVSVAVATAVIPEETALTRAATSVASVLDALILLSLGLLLLLAVALPILGRLVAPPVAEQAAALERVDLDPWHMVVRVVRATQHARTGTKAFVQFRDGTQCAAWFPGRRVTRNQVFAVQGRTSYGQHHHQTVFYVNAVTHQFSFRAWKRAR